MLVCGDHDFADVLGAHGASSVHVAEHELLDADYGPDAWGQTLALWIDEHDPDLVLACGTSKGNEVLAQAAARLDLPFVANVRRARRRRRRDDPRAMGRFAARAGISGRGLEDRFDRPPRSGSGAEGGAAECATESFAAELDESAAITIVQGREIAEAGVTLSTAPVVVGGGRAIGGAAEFAPLEELAELLGGRVGCSRAVTNNGWRPHSDQVGQTGTRIAPELYIASGISGAIQHWVGAMASKKILAINTDPEREHGDQGRLRRDRGSPRGDPGDRGRDQVAASGLTGTARIRLASTTSIPAAFIERRNHHNPTAMVSVVVAGPRNALMIRNFAIDWVRSR